MMVTGKKRRGAFDLGQHPLAHFGIKGDDLRQPVQHCLNITSVLAHNHDPVRRHILRQPHPVAIENLAAGGGDQTDVDAVFLGQKAELIGLIDLQVPHPCRKTAHKQQLRPAKQCGTARQLVVAGIILGAVASQTCLPCQARWPWASRSPGAVLRTRISPWVIRTTSG